MEVVTKENLGGDFTFDNVTKKIGVKPYEVLYRDEYDTLISDQREDEVAYEVKFLPKLGKLVVLYPERVRYHVDASYEGNTDESIQWRRVHGIVRTGEFTANLVQGSMKAVLRNDSIDNLTNVRLRINNATFPADARVSGFAVLVNGQKYMLDAHEDKDVPLGDLATGASIAIEFLNYPTHINNNTYHDQRDNRRQDPYSKGNGDDIGIIADTDKEVDSRVGGIALLAIHSIYADYSGVLRLGDLGIDLYENRSGLVKGAPASVQGELETATLDTVKSLELFQEPEAYGEQYARNRIVMGERKATVTNNGTEDLTNVRLAITNTYYPYAGRAEGFTLTVDGQEHAISKQEDQTIALGDLAVGASLELTFKNLAVLYTSSAYFYSGLPEYIYIYADTDKLQKTVVGGIEIKAVHEADLDSLGLELDSWKGGALRKKVTIADTTESAEGAQP